MINICNCMCNFCDFIALYNKHNSDKNFFFKCFIKPHNQIQNGKTYETETELVKNII